MPPTSLWCDSSSFFQASLQIKQEYGDHWGIGWSLINLGEVARRQGLHEQVPPRLRLAYSRCQKTSDDRTHTATTFLIIGMIPLLIVLCLPAISRRSRRSRRRRM